MIEEVALSIHDMCMTALGQQRITPQSCGILSQTRWRWLRERMEERTLQLDRRNKRPLAHGRWVALRYFRLVIEYVPFRWRKAELPHHVKGRQFQPLAVPYFLCTVLTLSAILDGRICADPECMPLEAVYLPHH